MQEFANVPHGQNNVTTVAVLHKHMDRNNNMLILGYNNEHYFVTWGNTSEVYSRTPQGLMHAVQEYDSCVASDLMAQCPDI